MELFEPLSEFFEG